MSKKRKKKKPPEDDRSLIEVSNDSGDHWVADVPTKGVEETEKSLKDAGAVPDRDESLLRRYNAKRVVDNRDSEEYRYRSARVVDEDEDLEDSGDREEDRSDFEPDSDDAEPDENREASEQPPVWKFW
ncbi:MAG: hypothetical protein AAFZ17_01460 [Cyanobacteria bacterium J06650_10]